MHVHLADTIVPPLHHLIIKIDHDISNGTILYSSITSALF